MVEQQIELDSGIKIPSDHLQGLGKMIHGKDCMQLQKYTIMNTLSHRNVSHGDSGLLLAMEISRHNLAVYFRRIPRAAVN